MNIFSRTLGRLRAALFAPPPDCPDPLEELDLDELADIPPWHEPPPRTGASSTTEYFRSSMSGIGPDCVHDC